MQWQHNTMWAHEWWVSRREIGVGTEGVWVSGRTRARERRTSGCIHGSVDKKQTVTIGQSFTKILWCSAVEEDGDIFGLWLTSSEINKLNVLFTNIKMCYDVLYFTREFCKYAYKFGLDGYTCWAILWARYWFIKVISVSISTDIKCHQNVKTMSAYLYLFII